MRRALLLLAVVMTGSVAGPWAAEAQSRPRDQKQSLDVARKLNESTVGLAAGQPEGAPLRFATELARVLDDGNEMRVLPVVTRGPFENVNDLLYLRGIDTAIINGDALEHFKKNPSMAGIERRINYLTHLFPSEVHIFVRPEIKTLQDLAGKPVNFNTKGTAAAYSGPMIFERLGIKVDARFDPHPVAMAGMANTDKYAATVWVSSKPLDAFLKRKWPEGFKFLPVPLTEKLEEYYLPAQLDAADYPGLIPAGQSIQTISVPAVLAVFAWPENSDRHRRVVRFIDYFFERLPRLQNEPGYHPRWKDINLAATVPGWQRFKAMQRKIDGVANAAPAGAPNAPKTAPPPLVPVAAKPASAAIAAAIAVPRALASGGPVEAEVRAALQRAGFEQIVSLALDSRKIWRGSAVKGGDRLSVAVDENGKVYSRRVAPR
jgi:TRAP-type uncharacterized transport system substrate-binding protein